MRRLLSICVAASLAACSEIPTTPSDMPRSGDTRELQRDQREAEARPAPAPVVLAPAAVVPASLALYKEEVARRIAAASGQMFTDPLPEMLRSVVVLEILIDRAGALQSASVRRSNRLRQFENVALESVRRAAPFPPPTGLATSPDGSVRFLETFLFRDDGRFQLRSLVTGV